MTELFRFRSRKYLLGEKYKELERQSIYFASPEELNDPMEGFRDIVWCGDNIVWENLFRHFIYCLHEIYVSFKISDHTDKMDSESIPIYGPPDEPPTEEYADLLNEIYRNTFEKACLDSLAEKLSSTKRRASQKEMLYYLQSIHLVAFDEIRTIYVDHDIARENERPVVNYRPQLAESNFFEAMQQVENEELLDAMFEVTMQIQNKYSLIINYNQRTEFSSTIGQNRYLMLFDFPRIYLKQLEKLLYPEWYAACFMKDYSDSSVWSHYGDQHKGACLIFESSKEPSGTESLKLNQITGWASHRGGNSRETWGLSPVPFHKIKYTTNAGEIDFFRSIGTLSQPILERVWYSDQHGKKSVCSSHIGSDQEGDWRKNYWDNFLRDITAKSNVWEHEQEYRLILNSFFTDLSEVEKRTLTYEFDSLKGIIFGLNISHVDKLKIIEIVESKCRKCNRTDFKFFQAYYSHKSGDIQKYDLGIDFSNLTV